MFGVFFSVDSFSFESSSSSPKNIPDILDADKDEADEGFICDGVDFDITGSVLFGVFFSVDSFSFESSSSSPKNIPDILDAEEDDADEGFICDGVDFDITVSVLFELFSFFPIIISDIELAIELIVDDADADDELVDSTEGTKPILLFTVIFLAYSPLLITEDFSDTLISSSSSENKIPDSSDNNDSPSSSSSYPIGFMNTGFITVVVMIFSIWVGSTDFTDTRLLHIFLISPFVILVESIF